MNTYIWNKSPTEITQLIAGKTIARCTHEEVEDEDYLCFEFTDGTVLRFRYDWIHEWTIKDETNEA